MLTLIAVPTDLLAQIGVNSSAVFSDLFPLAIILIGIGLALYVLDWIIGWFHDRPLTDYPEYEPWYNKFRSYR